MRISATPDIAGNERAVEELRAGLENAVAVAVGRPRPAVRARNEDRQRWLEHDVVAHVTADAAPRVAKLLERAIAERLARRRIYAPSADDATAPPPWMTDRQRRAG